MNEHDLNTTKRMLKTYLDESDPQKELEIIQNSEIITETIKGIPEMLTNHQKILITTKTDEILIPFEQSECLGIVRSDTNVLLEKIILSLNKPLSDSINDTEFVKNKNKFSEILNEVEVYIVI